jgi:hypothetical protein
VLVVLVVLVVQVLQVVQDVLVLLDHQFHEFLGLQDLLHHQVHQAVQVVQGNCSLTAVLQLPTLSCILSLSLLSHEVWHYLANCFSPLDLLLFSPAPLVCVEVLEPDGDDTDASDASHTLPSCNPEQSLFQKTRDLRVADGQPTPHGLVRDRRRATQSRPGRGGIWVDLQRNNEQEDTVLHFLLTV